MEDYLEAIYCIAQGQRVVRVKNIAERIGVKMPTVTNMLKALTRKGYIEYEKHEFLELTSKGREIGKEINRRHQTILEFLEHILDIDPETADSEACRIEHGMSADTLDRLIRFIGFLKQCPLPETCWMENPGSFRPKELSVDERLVHMKARARGLHQQIEHLEAGKGTPNDSK